MKIAMVLTGLARGWEKTYSNFKHIILDRHEVDVYVDIWSEVGWYTGKQYLQSPTDQYVKLAENDKGFYESGELVNLNKMVDLYRPKVLRVEDFNHYQYMFSDANERFPHAFTRPMNTLAQAYKIFSGCLMVKESDGYDCIIRSRPDILLENDFDLNTLELNNTFWSLPSRNKMGQGTGDSFHISSVKNMKAFATSMYLDIDALYKTVGYSCPHMYVEQVVKNLGLKKGEIMIGSKVEHSPSGIPYSEPV